MGYVERYVYAVGKQLPKTQREDIKREIYSLILDRVEERVYEGEKEDEAIFHVLKELGDPAELARQYQLHPYYVIGPLLFQTYLFVLKLAFFASGISLMLMNLIHPTNHWTQKIIQFGYDFIHVGVYVFGMVTLIFLLIERLEIQIQKKEMKWTPEKLPKIPKKHEKVSYPEVVFEIVFTIFALVFFNHSFTEMVSKSFLNGFLNTERFADFLLYWNVTWVSSLIIAITVLILGRNTIGLRAFNVFITFLQAMLIWMMYVDGELLRIQDLNEKALQWFHSTSISAIVVILLIGFWELWQIMKIKKRKH